MLSQTVQWDMICKIGAFRNSLYEQNSELVLGVATEWKRLLWMFLDRNISTAESAERI